MPPYRIYLRDRHGAIIGREDFHADGDPMARLIAERLFDACSDACTSFWLWQGARNVDTRLPQPSQNAGEIARITEEAVVRCEMALQESAWAIASSQRLLEQTAQLRGALTGDGVPSPAAPGGAEIMSDPPPVDGAPSK